MAWLGEISSPAAGLHPNLHNYDITCRNRDCSPTNTSAFTRIPVNNRQYGRDTEPSQRLPRTGDGDCTTARITTQASDTNVDRKSCLANRDSLACTNNHNHQNTYSHSLNERAATIIHSNINQTISRRSMVSHPL